MILLLHVFIALLGIISTTYGYLRPAQKTLRVSYALAILTFISGFYLVLAEPAQMLRACMSGVTYLVVVSLGVLATRKKLATIQSEVL